MQDGQFLHAEVSSLAQGKLTTYLRMLETVLVKLRSEVAVETYLALEFSGKTSTCKPCKFLSWNLC